MKTVKGKINSQTDEKIASLVEWITRHPKMIVVPKLSDQKLIEYAKEYAKKDEKFNGTQENITEILEEYKKMLEYYAYLRSIKRQGILTHEQEESCKEGGIGGVFGYSTEVENLAKKYGISEKDMYRLLAEFGTLDNFYEIYSAGKLNNNSFRELAKKIIRNVVDIDNDPNSGYNDLYSEIISIDSEDAGVYFYSSENLKKTIEAELTEKQKEVIRRRYGLTEEKADDEEKIYKNIGKKMGLSSQSAEREWASALRILKKPYVSRTFNITYGIDYDELSQTERVNINRIIKDIKLGNGNLPEKLAEIEQLSEAVATRINTEYKETLKERIVEGKISSLYPLRLYSREDLLALGLDPKRAAEISLKIEEYNTEEKLNTPIAELELSRRSYGALSSAGIHTIGDLTNMTEGELKSIKKLGEKSFDEILNKMTEFGISLKPEQDKTGPEKSGNSPKSSQLFSKYIGLVNNREIKNIPKAKDKESNATLEAARQDEGDIIRASLIKKQEKIDALVSEENALVAELEESQSTIDEEVKDE